MAVVEYAKGEVVTVGGGQVSEDVRGEHDGDGVTDPEEALDVHGRASVA